MNLQQRIYILFMFLVTLSGVYMNCNLQNQEDVLPVCTEASRTGQTVYIDTSQVAVDKLMTCYCSAVVTGSVAYVRVLFTAQNNPNCEVQFFVGPTRYCANADEKMYLDGAQMEEIKFEKSFRRDSTACLRLEVKKPDSENIQENPILTVTCSKGEVPDHIQEPTPQAVTMHPDPHSTPRPGTSRPGYTAPPMKDDENQAANSTTGGSGCPVQNCPSCNCPASANSTTGGSGCPVQNCPSCNCPACNCPACNCPSCNCAAQGENVVNENYTTGYSLPVLVGCSVGLFVAGCLIGVIVTLGVSYLRSSK